MREQVAIKKMKVQYVPTQYQIADIFTKSLSTSIFECLRLKLNLIEWIKMPNRYDRQVNGYEAKKKEDGPQTLMCMIQK